MIPESGLLFFGHSVYTGADGGARSRLTVAGARRDFH